ncbi:GntR family transcriptional regulator [Agrobacterium tumefaciens]|nr:GntR family transcriptional regulator [Agrobacterium tumefaciens]
MAERRHDDIAALCAAHGAEDVAALTGGGVQALHECEITVAGGAQQRVEVGADGVGKGSRITERLQALRLLKRGCLCYSISVRSLKESISVPLWNEVATTIKERIGSGVYEVGSVLPREVDLASELAVSRNTIREAFRYLSEEGMVDRRRRAGTRVLAKQSRSKVRLDLDPQTSLLHLSQRTRLVVQRCVEGPLPADLKANWPDAATGGWHRVDCLRMTGDEQPLSWTQFYFAPDLGELTRLVGGRAGQQFRLIEEHRGEQMSRTKTILVPMQVGTTVARSLDIPKDSLALKVIHAMINNSGQCREIVVSVYPVERYAFELAFSLE